MQLDAVETSFDRIPRGLCELFDCDLDITLAHLLRDDLLLHPLGIGVNVAGRRHCRRPEYARASGQIERMTYSSAMHELDEDLRVSGVNRIGDKLPSLDLFPGEYSRYAGIT